MKTTSVLPLNKARSGNYYKVLSVRLNKSERKRIFDLGFIPETIIKVIQKSPLGDPTAYSIRGTIIALREECTRKIIVKEV